MQILKENNNNSSTLIPPTKYVATATEMGAIDDTVDNYCDGSYDEEKEDLDENRFCTLAVTGTHPTFQAIFLCNECFVDSSPESGNASAEAPSSESPLCVCQACAEVCRDDGYHEVEYIGMGPSYCDCSRMGNCKLHEKSLREAERLGMVPKDGRQREAMCSTQTSSSEDFIRDTFDISMLQRVESGNARSTLATLLVEQARELIRHTKETHWIDEAVIGANNDGNGDASNQKKLCLLESLAWSIYQSHQKRYKSRVFHHDYVNDGGVSRGGAEWWVQVKDISTSSSPLNETNIDKNDVINNVDGNDEDPIRSLASSSIDLHYDKDEALAESFGIGSFPALSTVTYLTASPTTAAPTIVLDHTYTRGEDEVISSMMVSRPRIGKHICFDGRLLHGAPYHPSLLSSSTSNTTDTCEGTVLPTIQHRDDSRETSRRPQFRVTFLVNIWNDQRPANVLSLDDKIRDSILSVPQCEMTSEEEDALLFLAQTGNELPMTPLVIPKVSYEKEDDLPEAMKDRIELPFVSNLGEEEEDDDEESDQEGGSTVVVTFPPPRTDDCVLVTFGSGLQAYIDYNYGPEEDEDDADSNADQVDNESLRSPISKPQSEYV